MLLRLLLVGQGGLGQGRGGRGGLAALLTRLFKEEEEAVLLKVLLVEQVGEEVVGKREVGKREGATCDGLRGAVQCSSALSHKYWFYELAPYPTKIAFLKLLKTFGKVESTWFTGIKRIVPLAWRSLQNNQIWVYLLISTINIIRKSRNDF